MIAIKFFQTREYNPVFWGLEVRGHAAAKGSSLEEYGICAAVSTVVQFLMVGLVELLEISLVEGKLEAGDCRLFINKSSCSSETEMFFESARRLFDKIVSKYPQKLVLELVVR